jgi:endonuclease/exonuclease/phosphatase family metal-dependent hydrolase
VDLKLAFGGLTVLDGISLSVESAELLALIGPNGAGKTSVLNCISGIYHGRGRISFRGRDIADLSPRRIARVISEQAPDVVALQELEHGRLRSRGENQASKIAQILGYHVTFLATVTRGAERYGHAILSRWPIRTVKVAELPTRTFSIWPEPRGALWSRIFLGTTPINILTTHLGLSARERLEQMQTLLGPHWLGPILDTQAIVLCGDFNLPPGTPPYRLAADRLRDVEEMVGQGRNLQDLPADTIFTP